MTNKPLVSVIMPVFNSEKYLPEAINSILTQTYADFEFLIFDDGSTDGSKNVIENYANKDSRIKAFYSAMNHGYVKYLNQGIDNARGEYIARMDSDDISLPHRFYTQVTYLLNNPSVNVVGSSSVRIDGNGKDLGLSQRETDSSFLFWQSFFTNPLAHPTVMYRKNAIAVAGGYNPDKQPAEDYDLWTRMLTHGNIANIAEPLLKYREHENSISVKKRIVQIANSSESLKKHWDTLLRLKLTGEEVRFLKNFHKGYDDISSGDALGLFWKIVSLRNFVKDRNDILVSKTEMDFLKKSIYLVSKVKSLSLARAIPMAFTLAFLNPVAFVKFMIYGKL